MRMTLDDLIRKAVDESFDAAEVAAFCKEQAMTQAEFADVVSRSVATRYDSGELDFGFCDGVMNQLFGFAMKECEMPPYAFSVFLAFDEGEYYHPKDSRDTDPEQLYTRPAIAKILAGDAQ